jgi:hypothetical protein
MGFSFSPFHTAPEGTVIAVSTVCTNRRSQSYFRCIDAGFVFFGDHAALSQSISCRLMRDTTNGRRRFDDDAKKESFLYRFDRR